MSHKNKNHAQPSSIDIIKSALTISESEKVNTICYICDKHFICPCERKGYIKPKECTCALASYFNTYFMSHLLLTNDRCYLIHAYSDSCT